MTMNHIGRTLVPANAFNSEINSISHTTLAYIAGIVDGEGCIGIQKTRVKGRKHGVYYDHFSLRLEVASTNQGLIDLLVNLFGGSRYDGKRPNKKPYFRWMVSSAQAAMVLRLIQPWVFLKRTQVVLALDFAATMDRPMGKKVPTEIMARRGAYRDLLMHIKKIDDTSSRPSDVAL